MPPGDKYFHCTIVRLAEQHVFIVTLCALRPKMLETCDPEGVRCGILGQFVPPGAKGQVIFLDRSTSFKFCIYEGSYPAAGFESGFTGF